MDHLLHKKHIIFLGFTDNELKILNKELKCLILTKNDWNRYKYLEIEQEQNLNTTKDTEFCNLPTVYHTPDYKILINILNSKYYKNKDISSVSKENKTHFVPKKHNESVVSRDKKRASVDKETVVSGDKKTYSGENTMIIFFITKTNPYINVLYYLENYFKIGFMSENRLTNLQTIKIILSENIYQDFNNFCKTQWFIVNDSIIYTETMLVNYLKQF